MVGTRQSTPEFSGPAFEAAVQRAVDALLLGLTTQLTNEIRKNGIRGNGDQPPTIHTWLERLASYKFEGDALNCWKAFKQAKGGETYMATLSWKDFRDIYFLQYFPRSKQQKYEREYHTIRQRDEETIGELMKRFLRLAGFIDGKVNTEFTDVAQVANATRNMDILHERVETVIRSHNITEVSSTTVLLGKACHRVTGACFTCGLTGHMARDCPKNGGNGGRGDENDNQPAAKGRVFSSTKDHAANSSGIVSGTLFLNGRAIFVLFDMGTTHFAVFVLLGFLI
ncbi:putative reverse transcriptase domain-containing protein [Tanacetum coccineum]